MDDETMYESRESMPWYQSQDAAWECARAMHGEMSDSEIAYRAEMAQQADEEARRIPTYLGPDGRRYTIPENE